MIEMYASPLPPSYAHTNEKFHRVLVRVVAALVFAILFFYLKVSEGQPVYGAAPPSVTESCTGFGCYLQRFFESGLGVAVALAAMLFFAYGIFHVMILNRRGPRSSHRSVTPQNRPVL